MLTQNNDRLNYTVDNKVVGYIEIVEHTEYNYCKFFTIDQESRGKGLAAMLIDEYRQEHKKPFRYSLTSCGSVGAKFWAKYTADKKIERIKGETYEIKA